MQKHIELTHQAIAAYSSHNFEQAMDLLCKAFRQLHFSDLIFSDATYNAIFDAVEMVDVLFEHLPVLERSEEADLTIQNLKIALEELNLVEVDFFSKQVDDFQLLLKGLRVGFDFFEKRQIPLKIQPPMVSIAFKKGAYIQLIKWQNSAEVDRIINAFNASFSTPNSSLEDCQQQLELALSEGDKQRAEELLEDMMKRYPESKKQAFLKLGNLYFETKNYQKATEAYMKTIVLGTPKEMVRSNVQTACNALAAAAENPKEAGRWRDLLMNFF
ncbi:tetratricopeptide repeat protein [Aureispira anguillae]|uniref:Tetratricopeptide repeat protein n=1 Tax=Aureispira anguillae TaxID=2864201 RepID=A0A915YDY4_9BACT|nr:hypothetical protein [Aureispira anguillae]BDS11339.1 hypothetical protein AsAng_0020510 [Aureispira anguillae]